MKAAALKEFSDTGAPLTAFLSDSLSKGLFDAVLMHVEGPDGRSWPWTLIEDPAYLDKAVPVPPIMQVQGASALHSLAAAAGDRRIAAVLRPCESRSVVELAKLEQLDPEQILRLTVDCPGAVKMSDYVEGRTDGPDWSNREMLRPACRMCTRFIGYGDVRVSTNADGVFLTPLTDKGSSFLESAGLKADSDVPETDAEMEERKVEALAERERLLGKLSGEPGSIEWLTDLFSGCIGCRNCRDVCPVCYCRLCFIDTKDQKLTSAQHMTRSSQAGSARLVPGTLLFHIVRMAHVSLSCTSCGMCEDVCPADIPVAQLMSLVSEKTGLLFDYVPGLDPEKPAPLNTYLEGELSDFED